MSSSAAPLANPGRHTLGGTVLVFAAEFLLLPTGILTAAVLTRRLGPEDYGLFVLAVTVITWVEWTVTSCFSRPTIKFVAELDDWRPVGTTALRLHLLVGGAAMLLLVLLAAPLSALLNEPALTLYLLLFAVDIPLFTLAHAHRNILIGLGRFGPRALVSAGRWLTRLALIAGLVGLGLGVTGAILGSIGASLAELVIGRLFVQPSPFGRTRLPFREFFAYAIPLFLFAVSLRVYDKLDLFALKTLGGTAAQAGFYGAAQNLSLVPNLLALSFAPLLLSSLTRTLRGGDDHATRQVARDAMRLTIMVLPLAGLIAGSSPEIVGWIYGPQFLDAAPLLARLIYGAVALMMISTATAILTAAGKPGWTFTLTGPLIPVALVGYLVMIPWLGPVGAATVTSVVATCGAVLTAAAVQRVWQVHPPAATLARSVLLCAGAYVLAALWPAAGLLLLVKLPVLTLVVLLGFLILGEFDPNEIGLVRSMVRQRLTLRPSAPGAP